MQKWLFSDFDGTLKNAPDKKSITQQDFDFIQNWQNDGNKLIIATGRNYASVSKHLNNHYNIYPDYYVANTGGVVTDNKGKIIYSKTMANETKLKIIDYLQENRDDFFAVIYATVEEEKFLFYKKDRTAPEFQLFLGVEIADKDFDYLLDKDLICFKVLCDDKASWFKLLDYIEANDVLCSTVVNNVSGLNACEIHGENVNKGTGIRHLQETLKLNEEQIYVAGDDENDLGMFDEYREQSFIIRQPYNEKIRSRAGTELDHLYEIKNYIK